MGYKNSKIKTTEKKEEYLTRFIHRSVSIPDFNYGSWIKFFGEVLDYSLNQINDQLELSEINDIKQVLTQIEEDLMKVLSTPRLIKLFGRILKTKIDFFSNDLYIGDLICLCAIQAANQSLFHSIFRNKEYFLDLDTSDEYIKQSISDRIDPDERKKRVKEFRDNLKNTKRATESQINILTSTFHSFCHNGVRSVSVEELLSKRRLSHAVYFYVFFNYSELPYAISLEGLKKLEEACENKTYEEISEIISKQYNSLKETNLTESYMIFIRTLIKRDLSVSKAEKLLFAFGRAAEYFSDIPSYLSDKSSAAYSIWDFLKRLDSSIERQDVLLRMITEGVSHEFLANLVFYSIHEDRRPNNIELDTKHIAYIKYKFVKFCENKFYKNDIPLNIFNPTISDAPIQMLFRWHESAQEDEKNENIFDKYLSTLIRENLNATRSLIDAFLPTPGTSSRAEIEDKIGSFTKLISPKTFLKAASGHIEHLAKEKPIYKSMIEELEKRTKNLG